MAAMLLTDVKNFLEDEGLIGGATGWEGYAGYIPPTPDNVISVFETGGFPPEAAREGSTEQEYDEPTFQILARGDAHGYEDARNKIGAVYRALHDSELSPASGDPQYVYVYGLQSGPFPLGLDDNDRPRLTWNFKALRERES